MQAQDYTIGGRAIHNIPIIAFFNNQGHVGKTSLVYHLSWMYTELGLRIVAADYVAVPLSPDLFSLQGLRNLRPTLRKWRGEWKDRLTRNAISDLPLPQGEMQPIGYIVLQHAVRMDRPVKAYDRWIAHIPEEYREYVLQEATSSSPAVSNDPYCLALIKHYRSLMPLTQEAHKPMFSLKPADGAIGSHIQAVRGAFLDFRNLAQQIARKVQITL